MNQLYTELQWLPRAPHDFSSRLKAAASCGELRGSVVRSLASCALNLNQLIKLAKVVLNAEPTFKWPMFSKKLTKRRNV